MASHPPIILVDNKFDRINLYPLAALQSSAPAVGREAQYVADYRRERTFSQALAAASFNSVASDLGVGNTGTVDFAHIDRGHNLWGKTVQVVGDDGLGGSTTIVVNLLVPALGTVGGDPTTGWCVTEEGALYTLFSTSGARRRWIVQVVESWAPRFTGIILGNRVQLLGYSSVVDEDAGERSNQTEASQIPGYSGDDRTYSARKIELKLSMIGAAEYDSSIRTLRRLLFEVNQPFLCCVNYGLKPERTWLYKYRGSAWSGPTSRTMRSATITAFECGPLIR